MARNLLYFVKALMLAFICNNNSDGYIHLCGIFDGAIILSPSSAYQPHMGLHIAYQILLCSNYM